LVTCQGFSSVWGLAVKLRILLEVRQLANQHFDLATGTGWTAASDRGFDREISCGYALKGEGESLRVT
jgi:hypothetical protein